MAIVDVLIAIVTILLIFYLYLTWNYNYWQKRGVPSLKSVPGFGNIFGPMLQTGTFADLHNKIYEQFKDYKYCGYYFLRTPSIFLRDPELIKTVLIKNFASFHDNDFHINEKIDPLMGKNPFIVTGKRWKLVRSQLTPAFTTGKVKNMFPLIEEVTERFVKYLAKNLHTEHPQGLLAKEICARYTTDIVATCAMGINAKSFEDPKAIFREMGRKVVEPQSYFDGVRLLTIFALPRLADFINLKFIPADCAAFFSKLVHESLEYRKKNNVVVNDYFDFLIQLRERCTEYDFNEEHMTAHVITFFTDGFETSSVALSYALFELAANPDECSKLRYEIDSVIEQHNGKLTFDAIQAMPYLDCILSESLRMHPPLVFMRKVCTDPFKFPPAGKGGRELDVEKGMSIIIPVYALHYDPVYYPEPERFDPDRFSEERKHEIVKNAYLPFGDGPRACLGTRVALAQIKAAIVAILRHYEIRVNPRTLVPLKPDPQAFLLGPVGGIWLDFYKRSD